NRIEGDWLTQSATWVAQAVPYHVDGRIEVRDNTNSPVLTLGEGLELQFAQDNWLAAGLGEAGGLKIMGTSSARVVMRSVAPVATAGSWVGIVLGEYTLGGTDLDYLQISDAGQAYYSTQKGAITLDSTASRVTIHNSTFSNNLQSDIFVDCSSTPTLNGNTTPLGVVNESPCP
ncbi:MAG: hypothetical protein JXR83_23720, partial [Deltaproteobacteria bacterium]|nr:hypothetical protein [Deltaproteobacteria bacterium]